MPSPCRLRGTIRRCQKRLIASSPGAWQKIPRIASRTATNSLLSSIRSHVQTLPPRHPRLKSVFGGRSPADSATFGSPQPLVCPSLLLFRCPNPCAFASQFLLPLHSIFQSRKRPPKPSLIRRKQWPKHPCQSPQAISFRRSHKSALTGAPIVRGSSLRLERSSLALSLRGFRLLSSLHLRPPSLPRRLLPPPASRSKSHLQSPKARWPSLRTANYFSPQTSRRPRRANRSISSALFPPDRINSAWLFTNRIRVCVWKKKVWRKFGRTEQIPWPSTSLIVPSCSSAASSPWISPGPLAQRQLPNALPHP